MRRKPIIFNKNQKIEYDKRPEKSICLVCNKEFKVTDEHKFLINGEYVCSWKCFLKFVKEHPKNDKKRK